MAWRVRSPNVIPTERKELSRRASTSGSENRWMAVSRLPADWHWLKRVGPVIIYCKGPMVAKLECDDARDTAWDCAIFERSQQCKPYRRSLASVLSRASPINDEIIAECVRKVAYGRDVGGTRCFLERVARAREQTTFWCQWEATGFLTCRWLRSISTRPRWQRSAVLGAISFFSTAAKLPMPANDPL